MKLEDTGLTIDDFKINIKDGSLLYDSDTFKPKYRVITLEINDNTIPFTNIIPLEEIKKIKRIKEIKIDAINWYINTNRKFIRELKLKHLKKTYEKELF